ncbi:hypothetical protein G6F55_010277 [Rhizopus delemar]|nr:hypothetical protein G6F36_015679 [Rhizopus arrhizus]KAG1449205.1 hypothetical protein G6F55_010277 [Rhizopus delemar]KAG1519821.1 hypothetical protein G6F52_008249 [Rhizopus delemar]KAG1536315.1 hypothetical protein G6F51_011040 [Rhizopus arrhizus]KAG1549454.1 hypothetical protein G6F49_009593 [Rhizopus delemar]
MSVRAAALKSGVKESTAYAWWINYEKDPDSFTLEMKTNTQNRPNSHLQKENKQCLIESCDDGLGTYIQGAVEMPASKFASLEIKKSRLYEFMNDNCNLTFKKATFWSYVEQAQIPSKNVTIGSSREIIQIWFCYKLGFY